MYSILELSKSRLTTTEAQLKRLKTRYDEGAGNPVDYTDMQGQYALDKINIINAENNLKATQKQLARAKARLDAGEIAYDEASRERDQVKGELEEMLAQYEEMDYKSFFQMQNLDRTISLDENFDYNMVNVGVMFYTNKHRNNKRRSELTYNEILEQWAGIHSSEMKLLIQKNGI